jgi:hypothetical protein
MFSQDEHILAIHGRGIVCKKKIDAVLDVLLKFECINSDVYALYKIRRININPVR